MMMKRYAAWTMAALMAVSGVGQVMAEDAIIDVDEQAVVGADAGAEAGDGAENGDAAEDDGFLIEDDGEDVLIVEGREYADVKKEEEEQEKAREELEAMMNAQTLQLPAADSAQLEVYLEALEATPNLTGSEEEMTVASYIEEQMSFWGYTISEQNFHEGEVNEDGIDVPGINIIAERGATTEEHTDDIIVVTAHYDAAASGINDKSGAAVLLETGRILSQIDSDVDLCFVFLSGEEDGWYGSKAFAESIDDAEKARIKAVINLEDVGEGADLYLGTADGNNNQPGDYLAAASLLKAMEAADAAADVQAGETESAADAAADAAENAAENAQNADADVIIIDSAPDFWSYIARESGPAVHFAEQGMTAVSLFRENPDETDVLVDELFAEEMSEAEMSAEEETAEEAVEIVTEAESEETEKPAAGEKLAQVTDILTTALAAYMQPAKAEVNKD